MAEKRKKEKEMRENLKVGYTFEEELSLHKSHRKFHVERPQRIWAIFLQLEKHGLTENMYKVDGEPITDENLSLCHDSEYLKEFEKVVGVDDRIEEDIKPLERNINISHFMADTYENKWTQQWARLSAGWVIETVDALYTDMIKSAFCIIRPPGHHAHSFTASGFWFFNNIGLAARYAQKKYGVKKIWIFDWDVHFGDGTSQIFIEDPSVLYISPHRYQEGSFYPNKKEGGEDNIGKGEGRGYNINIPFNKEGMGNDEYIYIWENLVFPKIKEFKPDLILISAGFDSADGDPLGGFKLNPAGYAYMTQRMHELSPRIIAVLEGGYNVDVISNCSEAVVRILQGEKLPITSLEATQTIEEMIESSKPDEEAIRVVESVLSKLNEEGGDSKE